VRRSCTRVDIGCLIFAGSVSFGAGSSAGVNACDGRLSFRAFFCSDSSSPELGEERPRFLLVLAAFELVATCELAAWGFLVVRAV
jgi:hypothetical protein